MHVRDRATFEQLLTAHQEATAALKAAKDREHETMWALLNWVDRYAANAVAEESPNVPTGTHVYVGNGLPVPMAGQPVMLTTAQLDGGMYHAGNVAPVDSCQCYTCCEKRTLANIGKPVILETEFNPDLSGGVRPSILDTSGGP